MYSRKTTENDIEIDMEIDELIAEIKGEAGLIPFGKEDTKRIYLAVKQRDVKTLREYAELAYLNSIIAENSDIY